MNSNGKTLTLLGTIAASSLLSFGIALAVPGPAIMPGPKTSWAKSPRTRPSLRKA